METFNDVFGVVAAICSGIVFLAIFFSILNRFNRAARGFDVVKVRSFIQDGRLINVHLDIGPPILGVGFVGFTEPWSAKGGIPHKLSGMVVLETPMGAKILVRADAIRMIEEVEDPVIQ